MQNIFPLITQGEMGGGVWWGEKRIASQRPRGSTVLPKQLHCTEEALGFL